MKGGAGLVRWVPLVKPFELGDDLVVKLTCSRLSLH